MSATKKATPTKVTEPKEPAEAAASATTETVKKVVKASAEVASNSIEKADEASQAPVTAVAKVGDDAVKVYDDAISYGKDNFEAVLKANKLFTKGIEAINQELFAMLQASFSDNATATKKVLACSTVQEVVKLQNDLFSQSYSKTLEQSKKITDLSVKIVEDTASPISKRINVTVEKFAKPLAA